MRYKKHLLSVALVISLALLIRCFLFEIYRIPTAEMHPSLLEDDYVLVQKYSYGFRLPWIQKYLLNWEKPRRGDLVLLKRPKDNKYYFRRIIAEPGDRLYYSNNILIINEISYPYFLPSQTSLSGLDPEELIQNGWTYFQEEIQEEPYDILIKEKDKFSFGPYKLASDYYFVMGDHRTLSRDSRNWARYAQKAEGQVRVSRLNNANQTEARSIPKGSLLKWSKDPLFPVFFKTLEPAILKGNYVDIKVQATEKGLYGNLNQGELLQFTGRLYQQVEVYALSAFSKGEDHSLVALGSIHGKASKVLWSCKKSFSVPILCTLGKMSQ